MYITKTNTKLFICLVYVLFFILTYFGLEFLNDIYKTIKANGLVSLPLFHAFYLSYLLITIREEYEESEEDSIVFNFENSLVIMLIAYIYYFTKVIFSVI